MDKESDNVSVQLQMVKWAVVLGIEPAADANPLTVVKTFIHFITLLKRACSIYRKPCTYDKTIAINDSINEVIHTILKPLSSCFVVITMFLGSFRAMIIPVVTIPISLYRQLCCCNSLISRST